MLSAINIVEKEVHRANTLQLSSIKTSVPWSVWLVDSTIVAEYLMAFLLLPQPNELWGNEAPLRTLSRHKSDYKAPRL
jgi:hypothetical protein